MLCILCRDFRDPAPYLPLMFDFTDRFPDVRDIDRRNQTCSDFFMHSETMISSCIQRQTHFFFVFFHE